MQQVPDLGKKELRAYLDPRVRLLRFLVESSSGSSQRLTEEWRQARRSDREQSWGKTTDVRPSGSSLRE